SSNGIRPADVPGRRQVPGPAGPAGAGRRERPGTGFLAEWTAPMKRIHCRDAVRVGEQGPERPGPSDVPAALRMAGPPPLQEALPLPGCRVAEEWTAPRA